jgi:hypothetical protein
MPACYASEHGRPRWTRTARSPRAGRPSDGSSAPTGRPVGRSTNGSRGHGRSPCCAAPSPWASSTPPAPRARQQRSPPPAWRGRAWRTRAWPSKPTASSSGTASLTGSPRTTRCSPPRRPCSRSRTFWPRSGSWGGRSSPPPRPAAPTRSSPRRTPRRWPSASACAHLAHRADPLGLGLGRAWRPNCTASGKGEGGTWR